MASIISLLVTARDATSRGLGRAERSINAFTRRAERTLVRSIGDGLANGIGNGLRTAMSNPVTGAAVAALAIAIASMLGAALAGALVLAIGGAFVGLGVMLALQAKGVKEKWKSTLDELKPLFQDAASSMLPVIEHARQKFEEVGKAFAPHFKTALEEAAPAVQTFMDRIISGFKKLGETSAKPLEEAFNVFLDAFGPDMEDMLAGLGDALGALARTVRDNSSEISAALTGIIGLITTAVDIINFFARAWVWLIDTISQAIGRILQAVGFLVDGMLGAFEAMLGGLDKVAGSIPGIGDKFGQAKEAIGQFRESFRQSMDVVSQRAFAVGDDLDNINKTRVLQVNIDGWRNRLAIARAELKRTTDQKARAKITAEISDLEKKVRNAKAQLAELNGTTAYTYIVTKALASPNPNRGKQWGRAMGGVVGGAATGGARNNMTLVGEQGPELVNLGAGAHVRTNPDSRRMMSQGGGGGMEPFAIYLDLGGERIAEIMVDPMRKVVQRRGGVAATFGKL
jgi:methyl-accepting chemotaxis protein